MLFVCLFLSVEEFTYPLYICRVPSVDYNLYTCISLRSRQPASEVRKLDMMYMGGGDGDLPNLDVCVLLLSIMSGLQTL